MATSIVILATVGSFATNKNMFEVIQMYIAGVFGYILVKNNYPLSPVALALLLGKMLKSSIAQTMVMYPDNVLEMFSRPFTMVFTILVIFSFVWPIISNQLKKKKATKETA